MAFGRRAATVAGAARATSGRFPLGQRLAAILPMLGDAFLGRWSGAPRGKLLLALLGVGYVLSPLDVMPEAFLGPFGLGDDLAIALVSVAALLNAADSWLGRGSAASAGGQTPGGQTPGGQTPGDVIVGEVINRT